MTKNSDDPGGIMTHATGTRRSRLSLQTKALAGLVAIMLAAAIVALVFVTNGSGSNHPVAGADSPSDVGHNSSAPKSPAAPSEVSESPSSAAPTSAAATSAAPTSAAATSTAATSAAAPSSARASKSSASKVVYYTVKKGDNLTTISQWFSDHGYLELYNWNKSVIGEDPDLIFPGQRIIVVAGNVGVARPTK